MLVNVASDTIGILHVCGGDPIPLGSFTSAIGYSLHVCGGDPMQDIPNNLKTGILHACGGDPLRD